MVFIKSLTFEFLLQQSITSDKYHKNTLCINLADLKKLCGGDTRFSEFFLNLYMYIYIHKTNY